MTTAEREQSLKKRYGNRMAAAPGRGPGAGGPPGRGPGRGPGGPMGPGGKGFKPKNSKQTIKRLLSYIEQDKHQLVIGIGCTGGMHRSVAIGEELYRRLNDRGMRVTLEHRDLVLEETSIKMRFKSE